MGKNQHRLSWPLIVGPKRQVLARLIVGGDTAEGFQGSRSIAMNDHSIAKNPRGLAEDAVDIAISKTVVPENVGSQRIEEQRRIGIHGGLGIDDGGQWLIFHPDFFQRILGDVAALSRYGDDRFPDVTNLLPRQAIVRRFHRKGHQRAKRLGSRPDLLSRKHSNDSGNLERLRGVDGDDARMRMDAAQDRRMEHLGKADIGQIKAAARDEPLVLARPNRLPDVLILSHLKLQPSRQDAAESKSETRNPKQTETLKSEIQNKLFRILCFLIIWICFELRNSNFEFMSFKLTTA